MESMRVVEPPTKRMKRSIAWKNFIPNAENTAAECQLCAPKCMISMTRGSTTGLLRHLKSCHFTYQPSECVENDIKVDYEESISKLAALDGISFHAIANSTTLSTLYKSSGLTLHTSSNSIREVVMRCFEDKKTLITEEIKKCKDQGTTMSVSIDEWTSGASKRYLNINLHSSENTVWNLGLVRLEGSCSADVLLGHLQRKLNEYDIRLATDIVAVVTDGAAVMKRLGRISQTIQQLCFTHGIHLAVVRTIYSTANENEASSSDTGSSTEDSDSSLNIDVEPTSMPLRPNFARLVANVRKVVKLFKGSPLRNEVLQRYVRNKNGGNELYLILDTKTRWNSVVDMVERFIRLNEEIKEAMQDLHQEFTFTNVELITLKDMINVLKPIKLAVEALCRRDANLLTCDGAIEFMMKKVQAVGSLFSNEMLEALNERILERRTVFSETAYYLFHRKRGDRRGVDYFKGISKQELIASLKELTTPPEQNVHQNGAESQNIFSQTPEFQIQMSLEDELKNAIEAAYAKVPVSAQFTITHDSMLKKEMAMFENGGGRGALLTEAYNKLMSIPPSSVEAERAFSCANNFCTKLRSKLKDPTMNALVVLKYYYKSHG